MRVIAGIFVTLLTVFAPAAMSRSFCRVARYAGRGKDGSDGLVPGVRASAGLKYQLLPPLLERRPGNAAVWWNRLPATIELFLAELNKEFMENGRITTWMNIPIGDPREKAYRQKELAAVILLIQDDRLYSDMERAANRVVRLGVAVARGQFYLPDAPRCAAITHLRTHIVGRASGDRRRSIR